jgi:hypothetical protein
LRLQHERHCIVGCPAPPFAATTITVAAATLSYDGLFVAIAATTLSVAATTLSVAVVNNMLDRRLQLYLVGDSLGHHTHDHNQVSTDS